MANPEHLAMLKEGKEKWNEWRKLNQDVVIDLSDVEITKADFSEFNFHWSNFSGTRLERVDFTDCDLGSAHFFEATLKHVDFTASNLSEANFRYAGLANINFKAANLDNVDFQGTEIKCTDFSRATLRGTNFKHLRFLEVLFIDVDLTETVNLDKCIHIYPSVLDFYTLEQSGSLPLSFLRGCGLSDTFIDYLPSLLNQPIQFYSCFISYSSKDEDFAKRLHADLQNNGVRCWFAPKDMKGGQKLHEQIGDAIRLHEKLLLVLSKHSMHSEWVKTEIAKAKQREIKEKHQVLFPVALVPFDKVLEWECFDADTGKDSAREIREYYIPDFSNWKNHDAYQTTFNRLLKDLKLELERRPIL